MSNLPSNLPDLLRKHGLKVAEVPGWQTRGRPASTGGFAPVGVLCHHTATSKATTVEACLALLVKGRSDLPGPLCQLSLGRDGTVYIVAAGRANHAGWAKASGTVAGGDGNTLYIGIEAQNAGTGEPWLPPQYDAYFTLCAALSVEVTGNSAQSVRGHKETSTEGKIDPAGPTPDGPTFDMDKFRTHVAASIKAMKTPPPPPAPPATTQKIPARRVAHPRPGQPEYVGDSIRAIDTAAEKKIPWIDLNALISRDGIVVNTHYALPLHHGFVDPLGKIHPDTPVSALLWSDLERLRTRKDSPPYRIHQMSDMIAYAQRRGIGVELDLKDHIGKGSLSGLLAGLDKTKVEVKTMATRGPLAYADLQPAHELGLKTILLCHRPLIKVPASAQAFIDYYRGFKPRFV